MKEKLKKELTKLWTGELAAVVVFWIDFLIFKKDITSTQMLISIVFPLFVLSFILIQGSVFWLILLQRLSIPQFGIKYTGKIYRILKLFDVILLCIGLFLIIQNYSNIFVMTVSFFIWAFAVVEWVNYYKVRLSYSLDPFVLLEYIKNGKLKQSRIAKEIKNR